MNLPNSIVSDKSLKSILILGVITVIGTSLISQIMLQTGENVREYSVDLSDQVPGSDNYFNSLAVYPNGLPPYISSGGVYFPEITIFNIGFKIAGILFIFIGIEAFLRTASSLNSDDKKEHNFNNFSLACSIISGILVFSITFFPFDKKLMPHVIIAMLIFIFISIWIYSFMMARKKLDTEIMFKGSSINEIRHKIALFGFFSFLFMCFFVSLNMHSIGAIGEWGLMLTSQLQTLSFIPNLNKKIN